MKYLMEKSTDLSKKISSIVIKCDWWNSDFNVLLVQIQWIYCQKHKTYSKILHTVNDRIMLSFHFVLCNCKNYIYTLKKKGFSLLIL